MNLYILRHASAGTRRANALLDLKRPLDKEGKSQCLRLAHMLRALKVNFDLVISSPLKRSVQTAQFVATETGYETKIQISKALSPEATFAAFEQMLADSTGRENVLVVGHNPNLQGFVGSLLAPPVPDSDLADRVPLVRLRKGALARVVMGRGPATLSSLLDPRLVRALYATSTKRVLRKTSKK